MKLKELIARVRNERVTANGVQRIVDRSNNQSEDFQGMISVLREIFLTLFRLEGLTPRRLMDSPAYRSEAGKHQAFIADISAAFLEEGFSEEQLKRANGIGKFLALKTFLNDIARKAEYQTALAYRLAIRLGIEGENLIGPLSQEQQREARRTRSPLVFCDRRAYTPPFSEKKSIQQVIELYQLAERKVRSRQLADRARQEERIKGSTLSAEDVLGGRKKGYLAFNVLWGEGRQSEFLELELPGNGRIVVSAGTGQFEGLVGEEYIRGELPKNIFAALKRIEGGKKAAGQSETKILRLPRQTGTTG